VVDAKTFLQAVQEGKIPEVHGMLAQEPGLAGAKTEDGLSAVLLAVYLGHTQLGRMLAERRSDLTIFEASATGDAARVEALLAGDAKLANAYAPDGFQPLGLAAFFNYPSVARVLVGHGADVNSPARNPQQVVPLYSAAASGALEIAVLLLEHGADANARQAKQVVALHAAAQNGQVEMIELLLAHGADVNARAGNGLTPLGFALKSGHGHAAEALRESGGKE
jgi:uncharacterized protein